MSVQKLNFSSVKQAKKGFTTLLNDVVQNITDGFILGVYTYLSTLPSDWNINRVQLRAHFGVGRDKIDKALSWLNNNYLIEYKQDIDENGQFMPSYIEVQDGFEFIKNYKNNHTRNTATLKTRATDYPGTGKTAPTNTIGITNTNPIQKRVVVIPEFLDKELWERFKDHRKKIRKPMTDHAMTLLINKLTKFHEQGINVTELIEESIINGWSSVWAPKSSKPKLDIVTNNEPRSSVNRMREHVSERNISH